MLKNCFGETDSEIRSKRTIAEGSLKAHCDALARYWAGEFVPFERHALYRPLLADLNLRILFEA
jgi:hypothetical protein